MHCKHINPIYKEENQDFKILEKHWTPTEILCTYICNFPQTTSCVLLETLDRNMLTFLFMYIKYVWNIYAFSNRSAAWQFTCLQHFKEPAYLRVLLSFPLS